MSLGHTSNAQVNNLYTNQIYLIYSVVVWYNEQCEPYNRYAVQNCQVFQTHTPVHNCSHRFGRFGQ